MINQLSLLYDVRIYFLVVVPACSSQSIGTNPQQDPPRPKRHSRMQSGTGSLLQGCAKRSSWVAPPMVLELSVPRSSSQLVELKFSRYQGIRHGKPNLAAWKDLTGTLYAVPPLPTCRSTTPHILSLFALDPCITQDWATNTGIIHCTDPSIGISNISVMPSRWWPAAPSTLPCLLH